MIKAVASDRGRVTGEVLANWRQRLGLTQREAATALQMPFYTYRQYERGNSPIPSVVELAMNWVAYQNHTPTAKDKADDKNNTPTDH